ncbi:DUF2922 domain-containing protein [Peptoniphilus harei]|uniref:DUF2922 domain-containing protein n=1 Tax=Peptoniphilus harei TaxID=54005 RepID=UPI00254A881C|nr:DUF2922 domain-containing protein [Peptoniphilus harei]MDK7355019.1 DUF2922 domain-containing protein [Peptoniphilus harei]MDK7370579.1 DUF2922 domain-containing protein [Peptoniphilus harei]MDU2504012.1 DUF2922 domain-containing protein [Peptoniphilus harei]
MKETRTLRMSFVDEGGKPWTLTISNPNENVGIDDVKSVSNNITSNRLVKGKVGFVKTFNGAAIVTRKEAPIQ